MKHIVRSVTFVFVLIILLITTLEQGRSGWKAALFIPQILPDIPFRPLEYVSKKPVRQEIQFSTENGLKTADMYLPDDEGEYPAVIFFMGIVPPDRDEERVVMLAEGLARTGMIVFIPWLETQHSSRMVPEDIESLVDSFLFLEKHPLVDPQRIGYGGICTGASMATVAAQSPRINEKVSFVNSFAGYYDAFDLVTAAMSETRFSDNGRLPWKPDHLTRKLIVTHLLEGLDESDRTILDRIQIDGSWNNNQLNRLTGHGQAVLTLISAPTYEEAVLSIQGLSEKTRTFLEEVSPSTNISSLKASVLLMHDYHDRLVPSEESMRFAQEVRELSGHVYHTEFQLFQNAVQVHMDEESSMGIFNFTKEAFKLYRHMYRIMLLNG